jgi:hypothetical protein
MSESEVSKVHPISELEIKVILRDKDKRLKAEMVLARAPQSGILISLCSIGAALLASYMLRGFAAPDLTGLLLMGTFSGLITTMVQLWNVQRRLEAVIVLTNFQEHEKT